MYLARRINELLFAKLVWLTVFVLQFAQQLVACMHFVQMRHDLEKLGPNDKIREPKEQAAKEGA